MCEEIWQVIFVDYMVSNLGRVKSLKYGEPRILKPQLNSAGYLQVVLTIDGKSKHFFIHRLVALAFIPNPENLPQVNHINGIKTDNRLENLEWVTNSENQLHAFGKGLQKSGELHHKSKLTNEQVLYIRENPDGLTLEKLAEKFGVDFTTISNIQIGKTFKHVGGRLRKAQKRKFLTDDERTEILRRYREDGVSQTALAREFGRDAKTIRKIIHEE